MSLLTALAIGAKIIGTISEGKDVKKETGFRVNILEDRAFDVRQRAKTDVADFKKRASRTRAEARAAGGASGVELGTGSPLAAFSDFDSEVALQALRIVEGGELESKRLQQEAELTRRSGEQAQKRSRFRAGATLLSGLSDFG